jgi:hypothetical protein
MTRSGAGLGACSGETVQGPETQQVRCERPVASGGEPSGDWWATAEHLADVAQGVGGVELTTEARAVLVGMTVELLTVLTCWPNAVQPANALVYLRTRRARMGRHAAWFYSLPRHVRWFLAGTDRVPSLVLFAVSAPTIDARASRLWRKALASLNGLAKLGEGPTPEPAAAPTEPGQTGQLGSSDRRCRRRASRWQRGANAQAARGGGPPAHTPRPATCGDQGDCAGLPRLGSERRSRCCTMLSPSSSQPRTGRSPPLSC